MISSPADKNRRVLVIDDNRAIHDDFRKVLSPATATEAALDATEAALFGHGTEKVRPAAFEVDSAYQGEEGAMLVRQALEAGRPYAMAFVDVRMPPGWDGVETTRKMWELDPDLQVVLCTAHSDYSWGEMFEKLGQRDGLLILKKPFDAVEAFQLAHALTEKRALHEQSMRRMEGLEKMVAARTGELQQANQKLQSEVAERKRTAEELRESERRLSDMLRSLELLSMMLDQDGQITYCNDYLLRVTGWEREEVIGRGWFEIFAPPEIVDDLRKTFSALLTDRPDAWHHESEIVTRSRGRRLIRWNNSVLRSVAGEVIGTASIGEDITERRRLEARMFESQKIETAGKLAGGVAHEFNSILTAIIGQSELLLEDLPAGSPLAHNAIEISKAAQRAATLTRQLLAYGRKQFLLPEMLDLNRVLEDVKVVLHHLMGGGVQTEIVPALGLHAVKADVGQIEQVIMNMAINARDAMPHGGKFTLELSNVALDGEYAGRDLDLKPGSYVMLAITDTGAGMSEQVKARVFEPFFTTKDIGQGTGLGLATCYGIIKQSGGHISFSSEVGRGTTFKIYLPEFDPEAETINPRPDPSDLPRGTETILLVEDDSVLCEMAAAFLRRLGYTVLTAANGIEALNLNQKSDIGHIDLLFTDVVMPHMNGKELADRVEALYPRARILFTSAYPENTIVHQGMLAEGVALLKKPFTPAALAKKVREVLD